MIGIRDGFRFCAPCDFDSTWENHLSIAAKRGGVSLLKRPSALMMPKHCRRVAARQTRRDRLHNAAASGSHRPTMHRALIAPAQQQSAANSPAATSKSVPSLPKSCCCCCSSPCPLSTNTRHWKAGAADGLMLKVKYSECCRWLTVALAITTTTTTITNTATTTTTTLESSPFCSLEKSSKTLSESCPGSVRRTFSATTSGPAPPAAARR